MASWQLYWASSGWSCIGVNDTVKVDKPVVILYILVELSVV